MRELDYGKMGMRIRQLRKAKGWSQGGLAEKCGISMSFLGHIERGSRIMSMETFSNICLALESGADELLWGVAVPSDAVLGMWKGMDRTVREGGACSGKAGMQDADLETEDGHDKSRADRKNDSYAMYVRIMKSVAEIMNES